MIAVYIIPEPILGHLALGLNFLERNIGRVGVLGYVRRSNFFWKGDEEIVVASDTE